MARWLMLVALLGLAGCGGTQSCGPVTCQTGSVCCNDSCGICVIPGGSCTQQICQ
jgi:hypothetical protein